MDKVERKTLVEQVYSQMEKKIHDNEWQIGSKIPNETELMKQFGISRNTLREAVRALVHVGLLTTKQGEGTFVTHSDELNAILQRRLSKSTLADILDVRHALDKEAAVLACARYTDEDMLEMEKWMHACHAAVADGELDSFVDADISLHISVVKAAHNSLLLTLYTNIVEQMKISIEKTVSLADDYTIGHQQLIQAIKVRDQEAAMQEIDHYIHTFKKRI